MSDVCWRMNGDVVWTSGLSPEADSHPAVTLVKDVLAHTLYGLTRHESSMWCESK